MRALAAILAVVLLLGASVAGAANVDDTPGELALRNGRPVGRLETGTFFTEAIDREMPFFVYLPPGYGLDASVRYPVLYMLHGLGGENWEWAELGLLSAAEELMASGQIAPFVIVLPQGDQAYWFDHANGEDYGTYMARDVVAEIDRRYRTVPTREGRAIGGLSMGAAGALQLAINFPQVFGAVGAHGVTLRDYASMAEHLGDADMVRRWLGDERRNAAYDPLQLYGQRPELARRLTIWLDIGADDTRWRPGADELRRQLQEDGVPHEWHVLAGGHDPGQYQRAHTRKYLQFYGRALAPGGRRL